MGTNPEFQIFESKPSQLVKKGEILVRNGQSSCVVFYVVKGCLRSYIIDDKGKEHIYQFAPEDWIIGDLEFYKNKGSAFLNIDCIEDSEVKIIDLEFLTEIPHLSSQLAETSMRKLQNRVYSLQKRIIQLLACSAEERYLDFIKTYPNLVNRVPLRMIASYLGVTPESLSRVRKELKGKG